jgi:hypothetical protein
MSSSSKPSGGGKIDDTGVVVKHEILYSYFILLIPPLINQISVNGGSAGKRSLFDGPVKSANTDHFQNWHSIKSSSCKSQNDEFRLLTKASYLSKEKGGDRKNLLPFICRKGEIPSREENFKGSGAASLPSGSRSFRQVPGPRGKRRR